MNPPQIHGVYPSLGPTLSRVECHVPAHAPSVLGSLSLARHHFGAVFLGLHLPQFCVLALTFE